MKKLNSILMVDDDFDDREIFRDAIQSINPALRVEFAENGLEGLKKLQAAETMPDVIFSDINMPLMNGIQFLEAIKKQKAYDAVPIVMYTTSPIQSFMQQCFHLGAQQYIVKPNSFKMICAEIRKALKSLETIILSAED